MNRTKIEWTDYTWNPITGCKGGCWYCYARKMAKRFGKTEDARNFVPTFHPDRLKEPYEVKKGVRIFTCSVSDYFAKWTNGVWKHKVHEVIRGCPHHTFQILTKQYKQLFPMPLNTWIGVSISTRLLAQEAIDYLKGRTGKNIKFISFEPLQDKIMCDLKGVDWIIIGAMSNPKRIPPKEWVDELTTQAQNVGIPVFMKNNLGYEKPIQEFPEVRK